jgi:hypothetical protein
MLGLEDYEVYDNDDKRYAAGDDCLLLLYSSAILRRSNLRNTRER